MKHNYDKIAIHDDINYIDKSYFSNVFFLYFFLNVRGGGQMII